MTRDTRNTDIGHFARPSKLRNEKGETIMLKRMLMILILTMGVVGLVCSPELGLSIARAKTAGADLPHVLILATGGTIAGKASGCAGWLSDYIPGHTGRPRFSVPRFLRRRFLKIYSEPVLSRNFHHLGSGPISDVSRYRPESHPDGGNN